MTKILHTQISHMEFKDNKAVNKYKFNNKSRVRSLMNDFLKQRNSILYLLYVWFKSLKGISKEDLFDLEKQDL